MTWTEGHIWVTDELTINEPIFQYKYVLLESNGTTTWENGFDRLADLSLLDD